MTDELAAMAVGGFVSWTVLKDGDAIGSIDLSDMDGHDAWTGFAFRRDKWGQGLAREGLAAVIGHAFGPLRLNRVMARVQSGNHRARRLLEASGFQKERELPTISRDGESRAACLYALSRSAMKKGA
jgi:RimJ/RimL family protein N-acetyltransferase